MEGTLRISDAASIAMHAMAFIASRTVQGPMSVADLASRLGVSEAHLGKVLQRLVRHGYLASRRGPSGGYEPARDLGDLTLLEVYEAVDGPLRRGECLLGRRACAGGSCILGDLVGTVNEMVRAQLARTRIGDLEFETDRSRSADARRRPS